MRALAWAGDGGGGSGGAPVSHYIKFGESGGGGENEWKMQFA